MRELEPARPVRPCKATLRTLRVVVHSLSVLPSAPKPPVIETFVAVS